MANVGNLTIELVASLAKFQADLGKAVSASQKASKDISVAFSGLKGLLGGIVGGFSVHEIVGRIGDVIGAAAALDDLADATGSTVENLSKLKNQAEISGTSFETLQGLVLKLSAGMAGADDESSNVGRALKYLGVTAKDPAEALQQVAVALSKYTDGIGKAALARDLFGKGGPAFLATLKDIAELGDVQATVTTKQAAEAEKLEKAWRRLSVESTTLKNSILSDLVPALEGLISQFSLARKAGAGLFESLQAAGVDADSNLAPIISRIQARITKLNEQKTYAGKFKGPGFAADIQKEIEAEDRRLKIFTEIRNRGILAQQGDNADQVSRRFQRLQTADYTGTPDKADRAGRIAKDRISDAQRYLDQLEQQLQKTQELTTVETILADVESGRLKLSADVPLQRIIAIGQLIDASKEQAKLEKEQEKLRADEARTREQTSRLTQNAIKAAQDETESMAQQNVNLKEEIELIGKDATSIAQIIQARLDHAISLKQDELAMLQNAGAQKELTGAVEDQIRILQTRKGLLVQRGAAEKLAEEATRAKEINDLFVNSFADGVTEVVTGTKSIGDAFKDMERQIVASISRIAAQNIATAIFGGATSSGGGGIFASLGPFIAGLFGGGGGQGLAAGYGKAIGGPVSANQPYLVGERGPELFVPKQSGNIMPNSQLKSGAAGNVYHISTSVNVLPGASRTTADQAALQTGAAVQRALVRNG